MPTQEAHGLSGEQGAGDRACDVRSTAGAHDLGHGGIQRGSRPRAPRPATTLQPNRPAHCAHGSEGDARPSRHPRLALVCPAPSQGQGPPRCSAHACSPRLPAQPRHQVQRPEEEVHELGCAGVLDVLLQLGLEGGGRGMSRWQTDRWGDLKVSTEDGPGRGGAAGLTSRLMASLVFWKQSINSASEGGRARNVRTPSAMWGAVA